MNEFITRLAEAFHAHGKQFYLVGGTVRDELLDRPSHDIDCATDARPEEISRIAATTNPLHIIPIGEKFGTIQLQYTSAEATEPLLIEITTYRGERYTPGSRKPEVQFGTDLVEDLRRRDFTINAIAKNALTGEIVDPFGGQQDLDLWCIRAVDDPARRFAEDPLRLLRAVRFCFELNFGIEQATAEALLAQKAAVTTISQERIRDELCKALLMPYSPHHGRAPEDIFRLLRASELIDYILPEVNALFGVDQSPHHYHDVFNHTMLVFRKVPPRLTVRLAALLHDIAKPQTRSVDEAGVTHFYQHEDLGAGMARTILRRLRFGNDLVEHVATVIRLHMRVNAYTEKWSNGAVRRLYLDAGNTLEDLLDLAIADGCSDRNEPAEVVHQRIGHLGTRLKQVSIEARTRPIVSPLSGEELMEAFGRGPGPWIKPVKQHLHDLVVEETLRVDDKAGALAAARAFLEQQEQAREGALNNG